MPTTAITTSNSTRVNAARVRCRMVVTLLDFEVLVKSLALGNLDFQSPGPGARWGIDLGLGLSFALGTCLGHQVAGGVLRGDEHPVRAGCGAAGLFDLVLPIDDLGFSAGPGAA